jgi:hypothetical protein
MKMETTQAQAKFEGWAVVEMMGHQKEIGFVTTEYFGGAVILLDIPQQQLPANSDTTNPDPEATVCSPCLNGCHGECDEDVDCECTNPVHKNHVKEIGEEEAIG